MGGFATLPTALCVLLDMHVSGQIISESRYTSIIVSSSFHHRFIIASSSASCIFAESPPTIRQKVMSRCLPSCRATSSPCAASSRVGQSTRTRIAVIRFGPDKYGKPRPVAYTHHDNGTTTCTRPHVRYAVRSRGVRSRAARSLRACRVDVLIRYGRAAARARAA